MKFKYRSFGKYAAFTSLIGICLIGSPVRAQQVMDFLLPNAGGTPPNITTVGPKASSISNLNLPKIGNVISVDFQSNSDGGAATHCAPLLTNTSQNSVTIGFTSGSTLSGQTKTISNMVLAPGASVNVDQDNIINCFNAASPGSPAGSEVETAQVYLYNGGTNYDWWQAKWWAVLPSSTATTLIVFLSAEQLD